MTGSNLVSVIVPVYNVRDYLAECFDSIRCQSYNNIEIILVDDGSTDGSAELCDELASKDPRAIVVHKPNGGLSDARNVGLRVSRGEWISFVDSDDYISPIFIEVLLHAALGTGCQIAAIPFGETFVDGEACELVESRNSVPPAKSLDSPCVQRMMLYQALDTAAQWRLYARDTLDAEPFPFGLYYEDLASVYKIIHQVDRVALVDCRALYAYRMRKGSIIAQDYRHIKGKSALQISEELYANIGAWYPDLRVAAASRCFSVCRMVYAQLVTACDMDDEMVRDREALWAILSNYRKVILFDSCARKRERLAAAIACIGRHPFDLFCKTARRFGLIR